ncbi:MAG: dethiobiotin synthase [bacterium]|nr:dethiobiotin synthase [bacterium]
MGLVFITGTDTGVGKTHVTGHLAAAIRSLGHNITTQKWVQCGDLDCPDISAHNTAMGVTDAKDAMANARSVYEFQMAASPHLAAKEQGISINPSKLKAASTALQNTHDIVLIEGAGGLMVPLTDTLTTLDLVAEMSIPTIVVVDNKLGCINHALLTLSALTTHRIPVIGLIINHSAPPTSDPTATHISQDNPHIISQLGHAPVLGILPYNPDQKSYRDIAEKVIQYAIK